VPASRSTCSREEILPIFGKSFEVCSENIDKTVQVVENETKVSNYNILKTS